ncbi:MAG TPA: WG repeat-containing protein, partial [Pyrinomonadaceae bacterium]
MSPFLLTMSALLLLCYVAPCAAQQGGGGAPSLIWDERGKYGFIDRSGRVVIKPQFDGALPFTEGLAAVSIGKKWGFIDTSGKVVVALSYRAVSHFSDGLSAVTLDSATQTYDCGYIDHTGQYVIQPQREFTCRDFVEGLALVGVYNEASGEDLDGYMNKKGELAFGGQYALAEPFSEGLARVNDFNQTYFIDREGATAIDLSGYGGNDTL